MKYLLQASILVLHYPNIFQRLDSNASASVLRGLFIYVLDLPQNCDQDFLFSLVVFMQPVVATEMTCEFVATSKQFICKV